MIPSIPSSRAFRISYAVYVGVFFVYLLAPLAVVGAFAFNDSMFPSMPWKGFTLDWFASPVEPRLGLFHDSSLTDSVAVSFTVALAVTLLAVAVGTTNAFLFEREKFPFRNLAYILMLLPLVVPGVILGISILVLSNSFVNAVEDGIGWELESLRPGLLLVVLGQFSFIATVATLVISARLRKFDLTLEEAALNLGASRLAAVFTVTLPYLRPAILGAAIVAFLMSFENFNTTLMLVGSDAPLTIAMYDRLKEGSTPVINALSLMLMAGSAALALISIFVGRHREQQ
ncbi:MAG: ABC transporter permease [Alphaproteobacteria bacterium]|jgi:spermidine/putrescine transport system permease protein|nr:ABC transporter permease [Alphaproteobacteria bacterium]